MSGKEGIPVAAIKHCDFDMQRWWGRRKKTRSRAKGTRQRQRRGGGLKGGDLSGLDCVLIEVTCIKWNLIGTDTGSLTDRHDADGLGGGGQGEVVED